MRRGARPRFPARLAEIATANAVTIRIASQRHNSAKGRPITSCSTPVPCSQELGYFAQLRGGMTCCVARLGVSERGDGLKGDRKPGPSNFERGKDAKDAVLDGVGLLGGAQLGRIYRGDLAAFVTIARKPTEKCDEAGKHSARGVRSYDAFVG